VKRGATRRVAPLLPLSAVRGVRGSGASKADGPGTGVRWSGRSAGFPSGKRTLGRELRAVVDAYERSPSPSEQRPCPGEGARALWVQSKPSSHSSMCWATHATSSSVLTSPAATRTIIETISSGSSRVHLRPLTTTNRHMAA